MSGYHRSFSEGACKPVRALIREARNISELKRAQCIFFRSEYDLPPQQIAEMVGFDIGTVRNLHSAFLRNGEATLKLSGKGGRYHAYLTQEEEASWLDAFRESGQAGGVLEVGKIQTAFEEKVGRKVAKSTVYDLLHRHGWRKITPRPRHPKSDPEAVASFKKTSPIS
jgi:transposase